MILDVDRCAIPSCVRRLPDARVLFAPRAIAEVVPARGTVDSRVRAAPYDSEQVYRVRGFVGYQIDFEFEAGETFVGLGAGDMEGLSYFGQDNHLFLKPKAAKVATNLTVLTNRRRYQIDYTADAAAARRRRGRDFRAAVRLSAGAERRSSRASNRRRARGRGGQAPAESRLLVLRQPDAAPDRRLGRRCAHPPAVCGERGSARDVRTQRRRQRIAC